MKTRKFFTYTQQGSKQDIAEAVGEILRGSFRQNFNRLFFTRFLLNLDRLNGWLAKAEYVQFPSALGDWLESQRGRTLKTITLADLREFTLTADKNWSLSCPNEGVKDVDPFVHHIASMVRSAYEPTYTFYKTGVGSQVKLSVESSFDSHFEALKLFDDAFQELTDVEAGSLTPDADGVRNPIVGEDWVPDVDYVRKVGVLTQEERVRQLAREVLAEALLDERSNGWRNTVALELEDYELLLDKGVKFVSESWKPEVFIMPLFLK